MTQNIENVKKFTSKKLWRAPNKLNENGNGWNNQLTRSRKDFGLFEKFYKNDPWWREMKQRLENKNETQIELDRRLFEQAGSRPNLEEIKKLISMGAQPDHWVAEDGRWLYNAIMSPVNKDSQDRIEIAKLFCEKFPKFGISDRGRFETPLGRSIWLKMNKMAKTIIQSKTPINPIYSFLRRSLGQSKEKKMEILKTIDEFYNLSKVIQSDFEQIKKEGESNNPNVLSNLEVLFDICQSKGTDYLLKVFGQSYSIKSPLGWRFKKGNHFKWVAQELVNRNFKNGNCLIQNMGNDFKITGPSHNDTINDKSDPEFSTFLRSKIKIGEKVEIEMDDLLGIGGESLVIKFQSQSGLIAIKIIPLQDSDSKMKTAVQNDQNVIKKFEESEVGLEKIIQTEKESENILKNKDAVFYRRGQTSVQNLTP